ncbi:MAG: hypothetical protein ACK4GR_06045, partial [bacterium]
PKDKYLSYELFLVYNKRLFINPSIFQSKQNLNYTIEILELQIEGKKPIDSTSFINGYLNKLFKK